jgi:uncharacterized membrane protein
MADGTGRTRRILALVLGIPAGILFLLSITRPLLGEAGDVVDPLLSATCHRLPSRSLHLPWGVSGLCARCTSFWFAMAAGSILLLRPGLRPPFWSGLLLFLPLVIDGLLQKYTAYESITVLRVLTGLSAGLGIPVLAMR